MEKAPLQRHLSDRVLDALNDFAEAAIIRKRCNTDREQLVISALASPMVYADDIDATFEFLSDAYIHSIRRSGNVEGPSIPENKLPWIHATRSYRSTAGKEAGIKALYKLPLIELQIDANCAHLCKLFGKRNPGFILRTEGINDVNRTFTVSKRDL